MGLALGPAAGRPLLPTRVREKKRKQKGGCLRQMEGAGMEIREKNRQRMFRTRLVALSSAPIHILFFFLPNDGIPFDSFYFEPTTQSLSLRLFVSRFCPLFPHLTGSRIDSSRAVFSLAVRSNRWSVEPPRRDSPHSFLQPTARVGVKYQRLSLAGIHLEETILRGSSRDPMPEDTFWKELEPKNASHVSYVQ